MDDIEKEGSRTHCEARLLRRKTYKQESALRSCPLLTGLPSGEGERKKMSYYIQNKFLSISQVMCEQSDRLSSNLRVIWDDLTSEYRFCIMRKMSFCRVYTLCLEAGTSE